MDWLCEHIKSKEPRTNGGAFVNGTLRNSSDLTGSTSSEDDIEWDLQHISSWIIIPIVCILGLLGNLLSFLVFLYRLQERIEMMEKGSILGMIALSVSDFTFCLLTLTSTFYKVCAFLANLHRNEQKKPLV